MQLAVSRLLVTSDRQTDVALWAAARGFESESPLSLPGRAGLGASRCPTCCQLAYRPTHSVKAGSLHRLVSSLLYHTQRAIIHHLFMVEHPFGF